MGTISDSYFCIKNFLVIPCKLASAEKDALACQTPSSAGSWTCPFIPDPQSDCLRQPVRISTSSNFPIQGQSQPHSVKSSTWSSLLLSLFSFRLPLSMSRTVWTHPKSQGWDTHSACPASPCLFTPSWGWFHLGGLLAPRDWSWHTGWHLLAIFSYLSNLSFLLCQRHPPDTEIHCGGRMLRWPPAVPSSGVRGFCGFPFWVGMEPWIWWTIILWSS